MKTIYMYDEISDYGMSADYFRAELEYANGEDLEIRLNSPGGDVFQGLAIYNLMKSYSGNITVLVDGVAASIASIIALGGDKLTMGDGAFIMIHNPWSLVMGESEDLRQQADVQDKIKAQMLGIYSSKMTIDSEEISKLMDETTWLNAEEAKNYGLIDEILENSIKIAAKLDFNPKTNYFLNKVPHEVEKMTIKNEEVLETPEKVEVPEVKAEAETVEAPEVVETAEAPELEAKTEEFEELEVVATYTEEQVQEKIQAALDSEKKRAQEIKALAFDGQGELVNQLIDEGVEISAASQRIINHAKQNNLFGAKQDNSSALEQLNNSAPKSLARKDESIDGTSELENLRMEASRETDPKIKLQLTKKIIKLKKAASGQ